uniref:Putative secreted protein n=1 Tax=Ixodes ricinus TaxID=34613 RepID=A0A6B0U3E7_IXORI
MLRKCRAVRSLTPFFFFLNYFYAQRPRLRRPAFWDAGCRRFGCRGKTGCGPRRRSGARFGLRSLRESSSTFRVLRPRENGSAKMRRRRIGAPDC